ncbi:MAG: hypothetical protein ACPHY8_07120 [Patescibacteria group bacterium]
MYNAYFHVKKIVEPKKSKPRKKKSKKLKISQENKNQPSEVMKLSAQDKQKLIDIVKRAKINASK